MSGLALVAGAAALATQTALVAWGSWRVARRWWGDDGLTAVVAALVLGLAYVVVLLEGLGTIGLLVPVAPLVATVVVAAATARLVPAPDPRPWPPRPDRPLRAAASSWSGRLALAGVGASVATLVGPLIDSGVRWRPRFDALSSHLPVLAQMLQRESTWFFPYASPVAFSAHYPANAELVAAWVVLPLQRDFLVQQASTPGLLLTVLATVLLARELGARPWMAVAAGLVMPASPRSVVDLVGTNMQDLQMAGGVLVAFAMAARRWHRPGTPVGPDAVLAGLGAGLALGTRYAALLTVAPALVLLVVPSVAGADRWRAWLARWRRAVPVAAVAAGAMVLTGGYFYVRNQVFGSSPVYPQSVPWHEVEATERLNFPFISSYLELGWAPADWRAALGHIWRFDGPLLLALTLASLLPPVLLLLRRERTVRAWAWALTPVVAAVTFAATPAGPGLVFDGEVDRFSQALNLRYGIVYVALGAAVLAAAARRLAPAVEQSVVGVALLFGAATSIEKSRHDVQWAKVLAVTTALAFAAAGGAWVLTRIDRRVAAGVALAGLALGALAAPVVADRFDDRRLSSNLPFEGARLALEPLDGPVAVAGFCRIYGLYGPTFERDVEFLTGDDEGIDRPLAATADEWLASLHDHGVVALVVGTDICYSQLDLPYEDWVSEHPEVFELVGTSAEGSAYLVHQP